MKITPTNSKRLGWNYKLCPQCDQPILKKGQKRKSPTDYRHASGCPLDDWKKK